MRQILFLMLIFFITVTARPLDEEIVSLETTTDFETITFEPLKDHSRKEENLVTLPDAKPSCMARLLTPAKKRIAWYTSGSLIATAGVLGITLSITSLPSQDSNDAEKGALFLCSTLALCGGFSCVLYRLQQEKWYRTFCSSESSVRQSEDDVIVV